MPKHDCLEHYYGCIFFTLLIVLDSSDNQVAFSHFRSAQYLKEELSSFQNALKVSLNATTSAALEFAVQTHTALSQVLAFQMLLVFALVLCTHSFFSFLSHLARFTGISDYRLNFPPLQVQSWLEALTLSGPCHLSSSTLECNVLTPAHFLKWGLQVFILHDIPVLQFHCLLFPPRNTLGFHLLDLIGYH